MKESIRTTLGINLTFWRALLPPGALQTSPVPPGVTHVYPWWGENLTVGVEEGDQLVTMTTPWGIAIDRVVKPEPATESMGEAA